MKFLYFLKTAKKTKFSWRFLELNEPFFSEVKEGLISTKGEKDIYRIFVNISNVNQNRLSHLSRSISKIFKEHNEDR
jgi:hypothetical protein